MKQKIISAIITIVMLISLAAEAFASALPFTDVNAGDWFYNAVCDVYENDLMKGVEETVFAPDKTTSRAMIVTILARLSKEEITSITTAPFIDVKPDSWYGPSVAWAISKEITDGYPDGSFMPDKDVSREEIAAFLYRYLVCKGYDPEPGDATFKDEDKISGWSMNYVKALSGAGIILGDDNGRFNPQKNATRAETATMLSRLTEYLEKQAVDPSDEVKFIEETIEKNCPKHRITITGGYTATLTRKFLSEEIRRALGFDESFEVSLFPGDFSVISTEYGLANKGGGIQGKYEFDIHGPNGGFYRTSMSFMISKRPEEYYTKRIAKAAEEIEKTGVMFRSSSINDSELSRQIAARLEEIDGGTPFEGYQFANELKVSITGGLSELAASAEKAKGGDSVSAKISYKAEAGESSATGTVPVTLRIPGNDKNSSNFIYDEKVSVYVCDDTLSYADKLIDALKKDITDVNVIKATRDNAADILSVNNSDLAIIVGASSAPLGTQELLASYLKDGGRAMIIGGQLYGGGSDTDVVIDTICPVYYETFPVSEAASLSAEKDQLIVDDAKYALPDEVFSCAYYTQGEGFGNDRDFRQIPLIEIRDAKGLRSGYAAWITVFEGQSQRNKYEGALVSCFSAVGEKFYDDNGIKAVADTAKFMLAESRLIEGGADNYAYFGDENETVNYGALVSYSPDARGNVTVKTELMKENSILAEISEDFTSKYGEKSVMTSVSSSYDLSAGKPDRAVSTLYIDGIPVDRLAQDITFYTPKAESDRKYIYSENGNLMRDGKPVILYGVNYMPSNGKADENGYMHEFYFSRRAYDRDLIFEDLRRVKDIGFNAVSVFSYLNEEIATSNNIVDFLAMCEDMGLYADMSLRISFANALETEKTIKTLRFDEFDIISAYDICWEGRLGNYEGTGYQNLGRKTLDPHWREWLITQYGSYDAAEAVFGIAIPRDASGAIIGLSDNLMDASRPSPEELKMITAYRRFLDDSVAVYWNGIAQSVRSIDPHHLLGFRMTALGNGLEGMYDFRSLAPVLDIMEPEGYILNHSKSACIQAIFCNLYARMCNPDAPILWKEFGRSAWIGSNYRENELLSNEIKSLYEYALDAMLKGYSSGIYCWYFAGGYRIGEGSDYGIINPDGSDRPHTKVLREYADKFKSMGDIPDANYLITVDRDDYANGILGIYNKISTSLEKAVDEGKTVALVNKAETNGKTIYADETSDIRLTDGAEIGPLKYVNGIIISSSVSEENGVLAAELTVTNTHDAVWKSGSVSIVSADGTVTYGKINETLDSCDKANVKITIPALGTKVRFAVGGVLFGDAYTIN